jgi:hypothetical protein
MLTKLLLAMLPAPLRAPIFELSDDGSVAANPKKGFPFNRMKLRLTTVSPTPPTPQMKRHFRFLPAATIGTIGNVCLVFAALSAPVSAAVINLNFVNTTTFTTTTNPGYGLWGEGANTWNTTGLFANGTNQLVDSDGITTGVGYTYTASSGGTGRNSNAAWGPDALLQAGIFNSNDSTTLGILTITGLTANQGYELLVFHPSLNANNRIEIESANGVNPVDFTGSTTTTGGNTYNDAFDGVSNNSAFWYYSNVVANGSGQIVVTTSGGGHDVLAGFQIRPVPEPSAFALVGLSAFGLLIRRRA